MFIQDKIHKECKIIGVIIPYNSRVASKEIEVEKTRTITTPSESSKDWEELGQQLLQ